MGLALYHIFFQPPWTALPGTTHLFSPTRTNGFASPIYFGNIALLLGLCSLCSLPRWEKIWERILYAGLPFVAGITGSILSGTRGGWLAFLLIAGIFLIWGFSLFPRRIMLGIWVGVGLMIGIIYNIPKLNVQLRTQEAITETKNYLSEEKIQSGTSTSLRYFFLKVSWDIFSSHPWAGVGYARKIFKDYVRPLDPQAALEHAHPHNQLASMMITGGILGVLGWFFVHILPFIFFLKTIPKITFC